MATPAQNPYNVKLANKYDPSAIGASSTMTYHGMTIVVNNSIVGRLQTWNPSSYSRGGTHLWELNRDTWGRPVDYVPGKADAFTISFERAEIWGAEFERLLGYPEPWLDLLDQNIPFDMIEYLYKGNEKYRKWRYKGCWMTGKDYSDYTAEGDAIVKISGNISYVAKERL
jgi:hypothetical protein